MPFRPISEALSPLTSESGLPTDPELAPHRASLARFLPEWRDTTAFGDEESLLVVAEGLLRLLAVLGRGVGCLIVLEDLHDADAETLAIVDHLADNLVGLPVVLLTTARSQAGPARELVLGGGRRSGVTIVEPGRLDPLGVRDLVASCLGARPEDVPGAAVDRLFRDSGGLPFVVEELLDGMVAEGGLVAGPSGWSVQDVPVPVTVVLSISHRVDRLAPEAGALLAVAAVLGRRFPLSVVRAVCGLDGVDLLRHLRSAVDARLVAPDHPAPEWYSFRHALTADALLAGLGASERAELARRAADVLEAEHPGLPGEWCSATAFLRLRSGDLPTAAGLFAEAGRRMLADGAPATAVDLLRRAHDLPSPDDGARVAVLEPLLNALAGAGRVDQALALAPDLDDPGLGVERQASLHTVLARVAVRAGLWARGAEEIAVTRALLGPDAAPRLTAEVDVIAAALALRTQDVDRGTVAERLARQALLDAGRADLPEVACEALELLGTLARQQDLTESDGHFTRMGELAHHHRLRSVELRALARSGVNENLRSGRVVKLRRAHLHAFQVGAVTEGYLLEVDLVMVAVLRGEFLRAAELADHCAPVVTRMRLGDPIRHVLVAKAAMSAHRGRRAGMAGALAELDRWNGRGSHRTPLAHGLCEAFCALLEEDRPQAVRALDDAIASEERNPADQVLAGRYGLRVLLGVLAGVAGWREYEEAAAAPAGALAWNRQFLHLAKAVLLGRAGQSAAAAAAMVEHLQVSEPFAMARHLGLRLAAEAALTDGWGAPANWLREAEAYFHQDYVPAVTNACRVLLGQAGVSAAPHRGGTGDLPAPLRSRGVTVREHEVLRLLAERLDNVEIGKRLLISPRTVEKHVASLLAKTAQPDREALNRFASDHPTRRPE
ncbi:LuxR C-terminal-related transcriptional regulator [Umezawaea sp. Da 62-37]|uniref:helix-turn-helix transcriptional regulator n=1 Tax=Umezawaea sp. Da 62-37 TaxID=3075927 RepID=UPI0028F745BD|nr:LuxR C-terminal-related transcriptional regulator [Umezawaea sp. Da 62-37]WNV87264.1 LuxR C-terminal-related transcriptional regulator [Umezawaea sp. Da 62-37]